MCYSCKKLDCHLASAVQGATLRPPPGSEEEGEEGDEGEESTDGSEVLEPEALQLLEREEG